MAVHRGRTIRRKVVHELPALCVREAGAKPNMLQVAWVIEKAEQKRSDDGVLATFLPAEASDDTVAFALMLHLQHHAPIGLVDARHLLRHHAVEAGPLKAAEPVTGYGNVARRRREVERRCRPHQQGLESRTPLLEWRPLQISTAFAQKIEKRHRRGNLTG